MCCSHNNSSSKSHGLYTESELTLLEYLFFFFILCDCPTKRLKIPSSMSVRRQNKVSPLHFDLVIVLFIIALSRKISYGEESAKIWTLRSTKQFSLSVSCWRILVKESASRDFCIL